MLGHINYKNNQKWENDLPEGMINGQGMGTVKNFRYGLFSFGWCGCEIIAVYNFLKMLGRSLPLCDIAKEIYTYGHVLMGFFGTNVYVLGHYLKRHGIRTQSTRRKEDFLLRAQQGQFGIVSFWTGKVLRSSVHTVAFRIGENGRTTVYNRFNNKDCEYVFDSLKEAFGKYPFLTAHWV